MVEVKRYAIFYALAMSLVAHSLGGLQLSCCFFVVSRLDTWNLRYRLAGYVFIRDTSFVKKHDKLFKQILCISYFTAFISD